MTTYTQSLRSAFRFFLANGGYAVPPGRTACALSLARAERALLGSDLEFTTEPDQDPDLSFMTDDERAQPHEVIIVSIVKPCPDHGIDCKHAQYLASIGGVIDADQNYLRVLRAELASELEPEQFTSDSDSDSE